MALADDLSWQSSSFCRGTTHVDFFPSNRDKEAVNLAKGVCNRCTVKDPCLEYAVFNHIDEGIWGGMTDDERRRIGTFVKLRHSQSSAIKITQPVFKLELKPFTLEL